MRVLPLPFKVTARAQWEHSSPGAAALSPHSSCRTTSRWSQCW